MGIRAGLTEISPDLFEQVVAGGEPTMPNEPWHSIDKAWYDFHMVFRARGSPLSLAIAGDCLHPQSQHTLDEFCEGDHEYYMGFASPRLVREVAAALAVVSTSDYMRWQSDFFGNQYKHVESHFSNLKAAYAGAAGRGNAMMIFIC